MSQASIAPELVPNPFHGTSKYKQYSQAVEKALKAFENTNEWADLISALQKLSKVFSSNSKYGDIPKPVIVAKRLSQCLHPALPMGVHLKALETYRQVFDILGTEKLSQLLYLFAVGLFPLMDHCGIKVKSELFSIFEIYLLRLGANLRPSLPGFLAGVLLGLEEGTEFYERSVVFLDKVCDAVGPDAFYGCIWEAVLGSPPVRLPALIYVNAKLDKNKTMEEQRHLLNIPELMIEALCAAADDNGSPLVQRHLLDFLCTAFPFDSPLLSAEHFIKLLEHCLFVVLRRDMSLNRRLYQWLLNPTGSNLAVSGVAVGDDKLDVSFFLRNVLPLIQEALTNYLALETVELPAPSNMSHFGLLSKETEQTFSCEVRVCRLLLYLQDRPEIGKPVLLNILPVFLSGLVTRKATNTSGQVDSFSEYSSSGFKKIVEKAQAEKKIENVSKSFNLLLSSLDDGFIWDYLANWFSRLLNPQRDEDDQSIIPQEKIHEQLFHFSSVIRNCISLCQLDSSSSVRLVHIPTLLRSILKNLCDFQINDIPMDVYLDLISVCQKLLEEMTVGVGPISVSECDDSPATPIDSPVKKILGDTRRDKEQKLLEACLLDCLSLYDVISVHYLSKRSVEQLPLFMAICKLVSRFVDFPLYCLDLETPIQSKWIETLTRVLDAPAWANLGADCDFAARAACVDLLCYVYVRSSQVLEQHKAIHGKKDTCNANKSGSSTTTVLLKPMLLENDLKFLERNGTFEKSAKALWKTVSSSEHAFVHGQASRLLTIIHARRPGEPSSEAESIILAELTQQDQVACETAVRTFDRVWALTRGCEDLLPGLPPKLFSRVVMFLLGILSDESVSSEKITLKATAISWFVSCAKHNDLPRIVQMLSAMLMNPVTARVSIQYVSIDERITQAELPALPSGTQAITLFTADERHKMHHIIFDHQPEYSSTSNWLPELRSRLLATFEEVDTTLDRGADFLNRTRRPTQDHDIPNFDDDTDSLDTLSVSLNQAMVDGIEPAVYECLQYVIDLVVDAEETELDIERRFNEALASEKMSSDHVVFRAGVEQTENLPQAEAEKPPLPISAKDGVGRLKRGHRRTDSLQESIFSCGPELKLLEQCEIVTRPPHKQTSINDEGDVALFDELHTHMLLYGESGRLVDLSRCESAFRILTALLRPRGGPALPPRMLLNCLVSSGTSAQDASTSAISGSLVELMSRHVKAILGQQFWGSGGEEDGKQPSRHFTLLELLLTITLHFLRSYYLNSPIALVSDEDLIKSWKCKMAALDFLTSLLIELGEMLRSQQSQALVAFIQTIIQRSKLQKCLLHLLLTAVHDPRASDNGNIPISVTIAEFNEGIWAAPEKRQHISGLLSAYNSSLLALTAATIRLEHDIKIGYREFNDQTASGFIINRLPLTPTLTLTSQHRNTMRDSQPPLVELKMFLVTVLSAIKHKPERHDKWFQFVIYILPWIDRSLATFCTHVVEQLCKNIETAAVTAFPEMEKTISGRSPTESVLLAQAKYPANYLISCLETLTTVIHFCIIGGTGSLSSTIQDETKANRNSGTVQQPSSGMVGQAMQAIPGTQLLTNLVKAFTFSDTSSTTGVPLVKIDPRSSSWQEAKRQILGGLPHSLATLCDVWGVVRKETNPIFPIGSPHHLRHLIIDLLCPIAQSHQTQYLQAMSLVWLTRANIGIQNKTDADVASFSYSQAQLDVADLLLSVRMLPLETVLAGVAESLREQAGKTGKLSNSILEKNSFPTEAPLLELVHGCLRGLNTEQIRTCWPSLHSLFIDSSLTSLPPRAVFLQFIMLCDFVRIVGALYIVEDRTTVRAVHDSCQRLTEAVNGIVGWQLEATTWLKRTLVVKSEPTTGGKTSQSVDASPMQETVSNGLIEIGSSRGSTLSLLQNRPSSLDATNSLTSNTSSQYTNVLALQDSKKSNSSLRSSLKVQDSNNNKRDPAHSTQALFLLAENLPELIDSICKSDDKERLLPTLHAVWANVVPYLKSKNARYARFFLAASQLLANMSSYNYMRPVWKKITLELLLDSSFFRMDVHSIRQWLIVTDHLMTHDKTSFKELLKSISYTSSSLSLMQSREQEYEARTQALKRLAFIVFSSEVDQYQTQLPDIQERLAENLRVCPHPPIRASVLLCYRVLLIRLRPHSLVSMWPAMVTELIHVLLQVEQQLFDDPDANKEEFGARDDQWMQLFLAAAKLLEALCTLPAGYIAQFQMCNWAFVTSVATGESSTVFTPFANRISKRLQTKYGPYTEAELATTSSTLSGMKLLTSFEELRPFFYALTMHGRTIGQTNQKNASVFWREADILSGRLGLSAAISRLEQALYVDFAEHWQL